jgi:hypothetical protein
MGGSALIGDYIGCNLDTPSDSFTVSIGFHESYLYGQYNYFYYVNNLNKGCKDPTMDDSSGTSSRHEIGYRNIRIENGTNGECRIPIGYANLDISHSQITIRYFLDGDSTKYYEYVGKKIK